jgi:hypothetical protein
MENERRVLKTPNYVRKAQDAYRERLKDKDIDEYNKRNNEYNKRYRDNKRANMSDEEKQAYNQVMKIYMKNYRLKKNNSDVVENNNID